MSEGFRANPAALSEAAAKAHKHADQVEHHSRELHEKTRGKLLGRGKLGKIVQNAVRPIVHSMINDMSKAMADGHRSIGHGLEITAKNHRDAEKAIHKSLRADGRSLKSEGIELHPGQSVPGKKVLKAQYNREVDRRVAQLELQGHGVGRHLKVTDQQLKDRLGKPFKETVNVPQPPLTNARGFAVAQPPKQVSRWAKDEHGFAQSREKIDPLHGPDAKQRLAPPQLYHDKEKRNQHGDPMNHTCDRFSTAFKDNESYMYAELHARERIPSSPPYEVKFSPKDVWGRGGHEGMFRGYYIDPGNPMTNGRINYRDVNFKDAEIIAVYRPDGKGGFKLHTMFPQPKVEHNMGHHHH
ncbi:hypothetical protein ACH4E7_04025 [Kitasatospora sp. NPDC018058]|uniref:hypothetical protein n=1 Tax=Kitasatospora sp. NPDC018058 TaxID=3364025 RepID=UPI0037C16C1F